jgi:hypothetical protein
MDWGRRCLVGDAEYIEAYTQGSWYIGKYRVALGMVGNRAIRL